MAEVRSKMSDVKSQVMEARGTGEPRPSPSGSFSVEEVPSHHTDSELSACRKPGELDLLGRAAAARSRPCRPGEDCYAANAAIQLQCSSVTHLTDCRLKTSSDVLNFHNPKLKDHLWFLVDSPV